MWKIFFFMFLGITTQVVKGVQEVGDDCDYPEDCGDIENAICDSSYLCACKEGFVASSDKSECLPLAEKVGDECKIPEQCADIPNAKCNNNSCVLPQDECGFCFYTTGNSPDNSCIDHKPPVHTKQAEECKTDSDCSTLLMNRVCKNGTCTVELPSMPPKAILSTAVPDIFILGKPCVNSTDCTAEGSLCVDKQCKCEENFVSAMNLKSCLPKAKSVGDKCSETVQCLSLNGSICENEKCTLKTQNIQRGFTNLGENLPVPKLIIGSSCQNDKECEHMAHALCVESVCQCKDDYVTSLISNSCLEKAKKEGDPCEIDKQCEIIKGATCVQNKCIKPGIVNTKLGNPNAGSTLAISQLLAAILFAKSFFV